MDSGWLGCRPVPRVVSAHDDAEGEVFSTANENAGRARKTAPAGQAGLSLRWPYSKSMIAISVMSVSVTAQAAVDPGPTWKLQPHSPPMNTSDDRQSQWPPRS